MDLDHRVYVGILLSIYGEKGCGCKIIRNNLQINANIYSCLNKLVTNRMIDLTCHGNAGFYILNFYKHFKLQERIGESC